jgi:hypothetical protein
VVEHLPSIHEDLGIIPSNENENEKEKRETERETDRQTENMNISMLRKVINSHLISVVTLISDKP